MDKRKKRTVEVESRREKEREEPSRRKFLKKAAYAAPSLMILGQLGRPGDARADDFGPNPSDPNGW